MATRKWVLAGAALLTLAAGCASDPYYYDNAYYDNTVVYRDYPAYRYSEYPAPRYYSYAPGYYVPQPSVSLGLGYYRYR